MPTNTVQHINIEGNRFVLIRESQYERLRREAGRATDASDYKLPPLPEPDKNGNVSAIEYSRASIARDLISKRRDAGLSQTRLAKLAGVRQETISRIEGGKHTATTTTYDKIFDALDSVSTSKSNIRA